MFYIGRVCCGAVTGCLSVFVTMYRKSHSVREVTPISMSGRVASVTSTSIGFGIFLSLLLQESYVYYPNSFAFDLLLPILPSLFTFVSVAFIWTTMKYESPIYLWLTNKPTIAFQTIRQLAGESHSFSGIDDEDEAETVRPDQIKLSYKEIFHSPVLRKILVQVCLTAFLQQVTGFSSVLVYSSFYWRKKLHLPFAYSIIIGLALVSLLLSFLYIDSDLYTAVKRKLLIQLGAASLFVCNVLIAVLLNEVLAAFVSSMVFVVCFNLTLGPVM